MIKTRYLSKCYGTFEALDSLCLDIGAGEVFGYLGPNGAGKTTTIRILATLLPATRGEAEVCGQLVHENAEVRRQIGYVPDVWGVYTRLTVEEYLAFFAATYDVPRSKQRVAIADALELTGLGEHRKKMAGALSRGMQQRMGLARALVHDPKVLLLDEPASGLDPRARVEVRGILRELGRLGKTVFVSSHILTDIAEICTSIGILEGGRLVASGTIEEVLAAGGGGRAAQLNIGGDVDLGALLSSFEGLGYVEDLGDGRWRVQLGSVDAQEVLRRLVEQGVPVRSFEESHGNLEAAYMQLTEGRVS